MITVLNTTIYRAFGLRVASEIVLPELPESAQEECGTADAAIRLENLAGDWERLRGDDDFHAFGGGDFLLRVPGTAIFRVRGGNEIGVHPMKGANEHTIRLYLLGTCMGALLIQRKTLPLHGSAVVIDGKAYAFVGDSGAGKSTLAAAFGKLGYPLLSDDVIAVSLAGGRVPTVMPAYPQQKLWRDSIDRLGMDANRYNPIYLSKYAIPVPSLFHAEPVPLAGVFVLSNTDEKEANLLPLQGLVRLPTLQYHTFRSFLIPRFGLMRWHFRAAASIIRHTRMYRILRPEKGFEVFGLADRVLKAVQTRQTDRILHG